MHIAPLCFVLTFAVKDLDAMIFTIGNIHPAVGIAQNIMGNIELTRVGTW